MNYAINKEILKYLVTNKPSAYATIMGDEKSKMSGNVEFYSVPRGIIVLRGCLKPKPIFLLFMFMKVKIVGTIFKTLADIIILPLLLILCMLAICHHCFQMMAMHGKYFSPNALI